MTNSVTLAETAITRTVETRVMTSKGISTGFRLGQILINPADPGINISGIISIRNRKKLPKHKAKKFLNGCSK